MRVGTLRTLIREEIDRVISPNQGDVHLERERISSYVDPVSGKIVTHVEFPDRGESEIGHHPDQEEANLWSFSVVNKKRREKFSRGR